MIKLNVYCLTFSECGLKAAFFAHDCIHAAKKPPSLSFRTIQSGRKCVPLILDSQDHQSTPLLLSPPSSLSSQILRTLSSTSCAFSLPFCSTSLPLLFPTSIASLLLLFPTSTRSDVFALSLSKTLGDPVLGAAWWWGDGKILTPGMATGLKLLSQSVQPLPRPKPVPSQTGNARPVVVRRK